MANPELLWPQAAAELRSAWTAEGGRPYASEAEQRWIRSKGASDFPEEQFYCIRKFSEN
jgi:hypothetical protein